MRKEGTQINDKEKFLNEIEQLREMGADDAVEVIKGYHVMLERCISECTDEIKKIINLSPVSMRLTKTAVIIAESDFYSKHNNDGLEQLCLLGGQQELKELFKAIFKKCPEVFEELVKDAGYAKA